MKIQKIILTIISLMVISCSNDNYSITYYPNGQIKQKIKINALGQPEGCFEEFYENGELKTQGYYRNNLLNDTLKSYYQNGKLNEFGYMLNDYKSGWWSKYYKSGQLKNEKEFIVVDDTVSLRNQIISYNSEGKIDYDKSVYYKINLPDTLKRGVNIGKLNYYSKSNASKSYLYVIIENEKDNKIVIDTFANRFDYTEFAIVTNNLGEQTITGDIVEQLIYLEEMENDSIDMKIETKLKRFTKSVYVK